MMESGFILNLLCIAAGFSLMGLGAAYWLSSTRGSAKRLAFAGIACAILITLKSADNHPEYLLLTVWTMAWSVFLIYEPKT